MPSKILKSNRFPLLIVVLVLLAFNLLSCSGDDDQADLTPQPVRFNITGALQGSRGAGEGRVIFSETNGFHTLTIRLADSSATRAGTFNLDFVQGPEPNAIPLPEAGSYSLGGLVQDEAFTVIFTDLVSGTSFLGESHGTLEIISIDAQVVTGSFEFNSSTLTNPDNSIEVSNGLFRALLPQ